MRRRTWYQREQDQKSHEIERIAQFERDAKDDEQFKHKLLTRAGRCSPEKLERFITALQDSGHEALAGFIRGLYRDKV